MTSASITTIGSFFTAFSAGVARGVTYAAVALVQVPAVTKAAWRAWRNRGPVLRMLELDDHMLRDIGLTRGDVTSALASSGLIDPSARLRVMAVERRAARRMQARELVDLRREQERLARIATATDDGAPPHGVRIFAPQPD